MPDPPLGLLLLRAGQWFDQQLRIALAESGQPQLSPAQSLVFAELDPGGTPPAELARRLGHTRQAVQDLVAGLTRLDLLAVTDDPRRRGGRLVRLTPSGERLARDARRILAGLETTVDGGGELRRLITRLALDPRA